MQAASDFLESDFLESGDTDIWVISVPPTTTLDTIVSQDGNRSRSLIALKSRANLCDDHLSKVKSPSHIPPRF
jgi:hypothetical protein